MSLVIAIDCDDVLTDTLPQVVKDYNATYGTQLGLEHMYLDFSEISDALGTKTDQEAIQRFHAIYRRPGYYEALMPITGAVEAVAALAEHHELHLVTGRQSFLESATLATLDRYFPNMFQTVEHTNYYKDDTETDAVHRSKADVCKQIKADILVDDHITHGVDVLASGVSRVILFGSYPWNTKDVLISGMVRCNNWSEVLAQVEVIDGER